MNDLSEPVISPVPGDKRLYRLDEDFTTEVLGYRITVKKGFKTDGESIPNVFWLFTGDPFQPEGLAAAVVHDGLYGTEWLPRDKADLIFKTLLVQHGTSAFAATVRYRALRWFGGITWKTHTVTTIINARQYVAVSIVT